MNEFTKEELQELIRCVKLVIRSGIIPHSEKTIKLTINLQCMINKHCDHETEQGGSGGLSMYLCKKCGEFYTC